jgi:hypothetical protein
MLYSAIVSSRMYGQPTVIALELDTDDIDYTTLTEEDIITSMAILLSWVSNRHEGDAMAAGLEHIIFQAIKFSMHHYPNNVDTSLH